MAKQDACLPVAKGAWETARTERRSGCADVENRKVTTRRALACVVLAVAATSASSAELVLDADASLAYDDNLSRASSPVDVRGDWGAAVAGAAASFAAPSEFDALRVAIRGGAERFHRYRGLDNVSIEATASYRRKCGLGFAAPSILLEATAAYYDYDVDLRTGPRFAVRAGFGKRFTEVSEANVALFGEVRRSPYGEPDVPGVSGKVFDGNGYGIDVGASYALADNVTVAIAASWRHGDVVSTASETSAIVSKATAIAEDPTFGEDLYDYRLRGTTRAADVTISRALGDRASINLSYSAEWTSVGEGLDYRDRVVRLTFLYRH